MVRRAVQVVVGGLCIVALAVGCRPTAAAEGVTVGIGATTEQRVLAALTLVALERAGVAATVEEVGDTRDLHEAARRGEVDLFWDYSGAALSLELLRQQSPPTATQESFERAAKADSERGDLRWLGPSQANATLALFVRAAEMGETERTLTLLSRRLSEGPLALCADPDFVSRPEGLASLAEEYAISDEALRRTVAAPEPDAIAGVAAGECFAGLVTATSGAAQNAGLVPVDDDLRVFPAFVVAPVVRGATLARTPALEGALGQVIALLDSTARLRALNARVEDGTDPRVVAEEALGLATPPPSP